MPRSKPGPDAPPLTPTDEQRHGYRHSRSQDHAAGREDQASSAPERSVEPKMLAFAGWRMNSRATEATPTATVAVRHQRDIQARAMPSRRQKRIGTAAALRNPSRETAACFAILRAAVTVGHEVFSASETRTSSRRPASERGCFAAEGAITPLVRGGRSRCDPAISMTLLLLSRTSTVATSRRGCCSAAKEQSPPHLGGLVRAREPRSLRLTSAR